MRIDCTLSLHCLFPGIAVLECLKSYMQELYAHKKEETCNCHSLVGGMDWSPSCQRWRLLWPGIRLWSVRCLGRAPPPSVYEGVQHSHHRQTPVFMHEASYEQCAHLAQYFYKVDILTYDPWDVDSQVCSWVSVGYRNFAPQGKWDGFQKFVVDFGLTVYNQHSGSSVQVCKKLNVWVLIQVWISPFFYRSDRSLCQEKQHWFLCCDWFLFKKLHIGFPNSGDINVCSTCFEFCVLKLFCFCDVGGCLLFQVCGIEILQGKSHASYWWWFCWRCLMCCCTTIFNSFIHCLNVWLFAELVKKATWMIYVLRLLRIPVQEWIISHYQWSRASLNLAHNLCVAFVRHSSILDPPLAALSTWRVMRSFSHPKHEFNLAHFSAHFFMATC